MEASARPRSLALFLLLLFCVSRASSSFLNPFSECAQSRGRGASYRGSVDVTESGARCMNWSEVSGVSARYPGRGLGEHNFCRNPDSRIRPWCFFRNARGRVDWGYCDCKQVSTFSQISCIIMETWTFCTCVLCSWSSHCFSVFSVGVVTFNIICNLIENYNHLILLRRTLKHL